MKHLRRILWLVTGFAIVTCLNPSASLAAAIPRAERPTYKLGEKWIRSDGTYELIRIEDGRYVFAVAERDWEIELTQDLVVVKMRKGTDVMTFNSLPKLVWPLEIGRSGSGQVNWYRSWKPRAPTSVTFTWKVEAYEDVQTLAGTFKAFRIAHALSWKGRRGGGGGERGFSLWYAPDVRQFVKAGELVPAIGDDRMDFLAFQLVALDRPAPLQITLQGPADQARVPSDHLPLQGTVTGGQGVARVVITLNGQEVARHGPPLGTAPREVPLTATLPLQPGPNVLRVTATDPAGITQEATRTFVYDKPPSPVALRPATRWAVVVGIGRYEHPQIPRLRYAVPDAEAIARILTGPAGFKPEHVLLLTDTSERKPTYRNLKWALGTFLARSAQKDDTVLIFFAGHGAPEVDQRGLERDGLAKYLIPSDADPEDLYATALPMDELQTIFGRLEAERVVVLLDTCYSGAAGGRTFASLRTRAGSVDDLFLERLARTKGRAIITASRPNEVSLEVGEYGHGLFTYFLLQGLGGAADLNRDGIVSLQELYEYVEQEVTRTSRALGGNQHPVLKGELEGVLPLVTVTAPRP
jgi:hypothetical protein